MPIIKQRTIIVPKESIKYLADDCGVCKSTVYQSLRYFTLSEISQKIRRLAIEKYNGREIMKYRTI